MSERQSVRSARGGTGGVGNAQVGFPWLPGGMTVPEQPDMDRWTDRNPARDFFGRIGKWVGWKARSEPPNSPQVEYNSALPPWQQPRNLTPVTPAGASYRENRLPDRIGVDPWSGRGLYFGMADGGMNYGPPPRTEIAYAFEIPRIVRRANWGWAGLQQQGYVQDQRGSVAGYGAYIPHPGQAQPTRGWRSISMARMDSPRPFASDRVHIPAIFVPTAPIS